MDIIERDIFAVICGSDGIRARDIAKKLNRNKSVINHYLYASPYMHELCYQDSSCNWHGYIRQSRPHRGLEDFCGYYSTYEVARRTPEATVIVIRFGIVLACKLQI